LIRNGIALSILRLFRNKNDKDGKMAPCLRKGTFG
jgi:hypothetical protein